MLHYSHETTHYACWNDTFSTIMTSVVQFQFLGGFIFILCASYQMSKMSRCQFQFFFLNLEFNQYWNWNWPQIETKIGIKNLCLIKIKPKTGTNHKTYFIQVPIHIYIILIILSLLGHTKPKILSKIKNEEVETKTEVFLESKK